MLFFRFKLTLKFSTHLALLLVQLLALRCGRGKATHAAAATGAFASAAQADAYIETQAEEFTKLSGPAQKAFEKAAKAKRAQILATFGEALKKTGSLSTDPGEAKTELARLQHGIPSGKTADGVATLYGFSKLAEATTSAMTRQRVADRMAALRAIVFEKPGTGASARAAEQYDKMVTNPLPVGALRAIQEYAPGRARCKNCGRYASTLYGHNCPQTATPKTMERALRRRLGLPAGVYGEDTGGSAMYPGPEYLHMLIHEANLEHRYSPEGEVAGEKPRGTLSVYNPQTGDNQMVTLDGVLLALQQGYLPSAWQDNATGTLPVQVVAPKGQVVWVMDAKGLPRPSVPTNAVEAAALASGLDPAFVPEGLAESETGVMLAPIPATATPTAAAATIAASAVSVSGASAVEIEAAAVAARAWASEPTTSPTPAPAIASVTTGLRSLSLAGGSPYDLGRFSGNEWRKGTGTVITDGPRTYTIGDTLRDSTQWGTARKVGFYPNPPGGIKVGNNLVAAATLLAGGAELVKAPESTYELRDKGKGLMAVYDPTTATIGSTYNPVNDKGEPCASPEQWAAVMAYMIAEPGNDLETALGQDVKRYLEGEATALQVSDGAYIALSEKFKNEGWRPTLGSRVDGVTNCPNCGKFVGATPCPCRPPAPPVVPVVARPAATGGGGMDTGAAAASAPDTAPAPAAVVVAPAVSVFDSATFAETLAQNLTPILDRNSQATSDLSATLAGLGRSVQELGQRTSEAEARAAEYELRMASLMDSIAEKLVRPASAPAPFATGAGATTAAAPAPAPAPVVVKERKEAPPPPHRPDRTGPVTKLLAQVEPPGATDPYLMRVPPEMGGQRWEPLPQYYLPLDSDYELSEDGKKAISMVAASLQLAWHSDPSRRPKGTQFRAFGFAGTSGTGKNTTARQIAAALAQPYYEMTINKDTSIQEEIGQTVLTSDPVTGATVSTARLGKLGQAAASGAVICVNEVVKANPGILGALQTMMEDGYIEVAGTEAGMAGGRIPVHPNTVFIATWNPGYDGSAQRPDQALLSRLQVATMNSPSVDEQTNRLQKQVDNLLGAGKVSRAKCEAAAKFMMELQRMARGGPGVDREIARDSISPAEPTPREALRFLVTAEMSGGDYLLGLEQFKTYCDAGEDFENQWQKVQTVFKRIFGDDGRAVERSAAGRGPKMS
jgi:hypothetical protein